MTHSKGLFFNYVIKNGGGYPKRVIIDEPGGEGDQRVMSFIYKTVLVKNL